MESSQDELIIESIEIVVNVLNYSNFSVLAFLIYDSGTSQYSLDITILKFTPLALRFDNEVRLQRDRYNIVVTNSVAR